MAGVNWNIQWLNQNSQRAYPLVHWATRTDLTGTITLPDDFIVGLYLPVHAGLNVQPEKFYIKSLGIFASGLNIAIGYDDGDLLPLVATVNIATVTHTENRSYALVGSDEFDDSVGKIVIGRLDNVLALPPGQYTFAPTATQLETDTVRPMLRGLTSLTVINGADRSQRIYGDVELVAKNNMRIVVTEIAGQPTQIAFSAISGEGLNDECGCEEDNTVPIRFINGIPPGPDGNYKIVGNGCISITPITNGLELTDTCSSPCCGCAELAALEMQVRSFRDGAVTLQQFATRLEAEVTQMNQTVLGSQLSDSGCTECS